MGSSERILILGGARSGKSHHAQQLAEQIGGRNVLYVATAQPLDEEMRSRIAVHRDERPDGWITLETPRQVAEAIAGMQWREAERRTKSATRKAASRDGGNTIRVVLIDCLTLLASNVLMDYLDSDQTMFKAALFAEVDALLALQAEQQNTWILVSNEVGLGLVPDNRLGRLYRDGLGRINQRIAAQADRVIFMIAGIPWEVKGNR